MPPDTALSFGGFVFLPTAQDMSNTLQLRPAWV